MLIFWEVMRVTSPQNPTDAHAKWLDWVQKLTRENRYVAGEALLPGGKTISGAKKVVTDGPFAESKEVVGGFFVVLAKNLAEATEIAKECPDYILNGVVEVREVMKFDDVETNGSPELETQSS